MPEAIPREFTMERQGKTAILYAGLLSLAHDRGLQSIETQLIQTPSEANDHTAICFAKVTMRDFTKDGGVESYVTKTFTGIGDANPPNVGRMMTPHIIRMAETRAKARALRDAINVGVVALEELGDDDEGDQRPQAPRQAAPPPAPRPNPQPNVRPPASVQHPPVQAPAAPPANGDSDLPPEVARLTTSVHALYREWKKAIAEAKDDERLGQLDADLNERLGKRMIPKQVYDPLMALLVERSAQLAGGPG